MSEVVSLKNVSVNFDYVTVLEEVNLAIHQNDFLGIIGPNGGGKTTLLKVILGLVEPNQGSVTVLGGRPEDNRRFVGYVPQYYQFDREFPVNVWDVVLMGRLRHSRHFRSYSEDDERVVADALKTVGMLELRDRKVGLLSGGEKQRVFVARALASRPKLLLLDEPASSIDKPTERGFYELLHDLNRNVTIILVTHDISVISVHVNKIACLNRRLYYHGSKEITAETLEKVYRCPVDMIAHGVPHRVVREHED